MLSGLGLALRAGRLRVGLEAVQQSVRGNRARAVVIAGDAPEKLRRRLERLLGSAGVPFAVVVDGDQLGRAVGRERVVVLAITSDSLGKRVLELAKEVEG